MTTNGNTEQAAHSFGFEDLKNFLAEIFEKHGASPHVSAILADTCARAERDGAKSHGVFRIPGYVDTLRSGYVDGRAKPTLDTVAAGFLQVDAANGFAQPALASVRQPLMDAASKNGIALAAIRDSHHFGALWLDVEPFADEGFIALTSVNSIARMSSFGGNKPVYGTNPLAFAAPRVDGPPLVFDFATSALAFGEVRLAALHGESLPDNCGVDSLGDPTTDPKKIVDGGSLLPFGGYKGSSLAMMVELLSAALTGSAFSVEVDQSGNPGAQTSRTGQMVILIDAGKSFAGAFGERTAQLSDTLKRFGQDRLPSDRRYANRAAADRDGIFIDTAAYTAMAALQ